MKSKSSNKALFENAIAHAVALERFKKAEAQRVASYLRDAVWPDVLSRVPNAHRRATQADIVSIVRRADIGLVDSMVELGKAEAKFATAGLMKAVPLNAVSFNTIGLETVRAIVNDSPVNGRTLSEWLDSFSLNTSNNVLAQLRLGIVQGESVDDMSRRLREIAFPKATRDAQTIARTASNHVSSAAREETYAANADVVDKVQIVATLDTRTSLVCIDRDGEVYPINEGPRPPFHPNCRTTTVPVTKSWAELGADLKEEVPESSRASMDGQVPERQTYEEWLKLQSEDTQKEALGAKRATLFREGKIKANDLTNEFGEAITVKQLEAMAGVTTSSKQVETKNMLVDALFAGDTKKREALGWKPRTRLREEFSKPNKGAVTWKLNGGNIRIESKRWNGDLAEYARQYWKSKDPRFYLRKRVDYIEAPVVVRGIDMRLADIGYTGTRPKDEATLQALLAQFVEAAPKKGTIAYAEWKEANATSDSTRHYWRNRVRALRNINKLGLSEEELVDIRTALLRKYSAAKVDAIIANAKSRAELLRESLD